MDLRSFISQEEKLGNVFHIKRKVSPVYEAAAVMKKLDGGPRIFFEDLGGFRAVGNVVCSRARLYRALNVKEEDYHKVVGRAVSEPIKPQEVEPPEYYRELKGGFDELPILKHYEGDGGRYITAGIVAAKSVDGEFQNESVHRILVLGKHKATLRVVPRHLYTMIKEAEKKGVNLDVAVVIGVHPTVLFAAATSPPYKVSHLSVANRLLGGDLKVFKTENGVYVPLGAEIIILGEIIPDELVEEGPFVDLTGTMDITRLQPTLRVDKILVREDFIYQALLPAGMEHMLLQGLPREAIIKSYVERVVPRVHKVRLTRGGIGWLHAVVSISKVREGDGKNVLMACFAAHPSLKMAIVVDEDIDPDNPTEVEWALATRFQADKDLIIIRGATSSSLDPSGDQSIGIGAKMGIDATMPIKGRDKFVRARIPVSVEWVGEE